MPAHREQDRRPCLKVDIMVQPPIPGGKPELLSRNSAEGRKDTAAALADAIRKVSSSGSGLDEALKAEKEGEDRVAEAGDNRAQSFTQPVKRPQSHHRQVSKLAWAAITCFARPLRCSEQS